MRQWTCVAAAREDAIGAARGVTPPSIWISMGRHPAARNLHPNRCSVSFMSASSSVFKRYETHDCVGIHLPTTPPHLYIKQLLATFLLNLFVQEFCVFTQPALRQLCEIFVCFQFFSAPQTHPSTFEVSDQHKLSRVLSAPTCHHTSERYKNTLLEALQPLAAVPESLPPTTLRHRPSPPHQTAAPTTLTKQ